MIVFAGESPELGGGPPLIANAGDSLRSLEVAAGEQVDPVRVLGSSPCIGTLAIRRFLRPVCYENVPRELLARGSVGLTAAATLGIGAALWKSRMNEATRQKLMNVSVAALATALFRPGIRHQVIQGEAKGRNMVGPAFTLRYIPAREGRSSLSVFRNPTHPQRVAIETCPPGHVLVMDSRKSATAASAGDILITRLMMRGGAGVVTDGGFRDAPTR